MNFSFKMIISINKEKNLKYDKKNSRRRKIITNDITEIILVFKM